MGENKRFLRGHLALCATCLLMSCYGHARIDASQEVAVRQELIQVALAREPADLILRGATVLNVFTAEWLPAQDIVVAGERIAWVGPQGSWPGKANKTVDVSGKWAVPAFGESHKHIESSYLTPEYEAALVIPKGNTWTVEGSHEMSNVVGMENINFWLAAEDAGSPLKIFPAVGSATPPTVYEQGGGYYGYKEMTDFLRQDLRVVALGEVMDWPAVSNPDAPGSERIWGMIQATWEQRGTVEGHASGLRSLAEINAFAAAGLSSDHEVRLAEEGLHKLRRGIFLEVRADAARLLFPKMQELGLKDFSNISVTTDDRDVAATSTLGAMDYNIRNAIEAGAPTIQAYLMGSYNTARHFKIDHLVGAIAPGRYADVVLLNNPDEVNIHQVYANGKLAGQRTGAGDEYLMPIAKVEYPDWLKQTIKLDRPMAAADFVINAPAGRSTVNAALMEPFYFGETFMQVELPVVDGVVNADPAESISKVAVVDRYRGDGETSRMFWRNVGPKTPNSALASSQMHDIHNIWVVGNSDSAMAQAVNAVADLQGGWALVNNGKVVATVQLNIAGLMSARPVAEVGAAVEALFDAADAMEWIGQPGLPERMRFAFLTASPWRWQLVAPTEEIPQGFVNVTNGDSHPVVW
ncbi:MAG: adenine deaminase C-terminal domain-containing protein [Pseudomonadota bacterium]